MKKQYQIDGRDPSAKGYVCENRLADEVEREIVVTALKIFGVKDSNNRLVYLYGRLDDVHGWYLFAVARNEYVILGDCLDVLEEPYNKVLTIGEVAKFAKEFGSGENIGTAYEAMTEWGVPLGEGDFDGTVWVLSMMKGNRVCPEIHKTMEGCVDGVIAELKNTKAQDFGGEHDYEAVKAQLREAQVWEDDNTGWRYDITECPVCNR